MVWKFYEIWIFFMGIAFQMGQILWEYGMYAFWKGIYSKM